MILRLPQWPRISNRRINNRRRVQRRPQPQRAAVATESLESKVLLSGTGNPVESSLDRTDWQDIDGTGTSGDLWIAVTLSEATSSSVQASLEAYQQHIDAGNANQVFEIEPLKLRLVNFTGFDRSLHHGDFSAIYDNVIVGTWRSETLIGTANRDLIVGHGGNDLIQGGGWDDILIGGNGWDTLEGGDGSDVVLYSGTGNGFDIFNGGAGEDRAIAVETSTLIGINGYANGVEEFVGQGDTIIRDSWHSHTLDFSNTALEGIAEVDAGSGNDTVIASDITPGTYRGNYGYDTLRAGEQDTTWLYAGTGNGYDRFLDNTAATVTAVAETAGNFIGVNGYLNGVDFFQGAAAGDTIVRDTWHSHTLDFSDTQLIDIAEVDAASGHDTVIASSLSVASYRGSSGNDTLRAGSRDVNCLYSGTGNGYDRFLENNGATINAVAESVGTIIGVNGYLNGVDAFLGTGDTIIRDTWHSHTLNFSDTQLLDIAEVDAASGHDTVIASNLSVGAYRGNSGNDRLTAGSQDVTWLYAGDGNGYDVLDGNGPADVVARAETAGTVIGVNGYENGVDAFEGFGDDGTLIRDTWHSHTLDFSDTELNNISEVDAASGHDTVFASNLSVASYRGGSGNDSLNAGAVDTTWLYSGAGNGYDSFYDNGAAIVIARAESDGTVFGVNGYDNGVDVFEGFGDDGSVIRDTWHSHTLNFSETQLVNISEVDAASGHDTIIASDVAAAAYRGGSGNDNLFAGLAATTWLYSGDGNGYDNLRDNGENTVIARAESAGTVIGIGSYENGVDLFDGHDSGDTIIRNSWHSHTLDFSLTELANIAEVDAASGNDTVTSSDISPGSFRGGSGNDTLIAGKQPVVWLYSGDGDGLDSYQHNGNANVRATLDHEPDPAGPTQGTTGTGLDQVVDIIYADPGLNRRIPEADIAGGAAAADAMNHIILAAINATGLANDDEISTSDLHDLNAWIQANRYKEWVTLHGDDDGNQETGFHLVQNDGATTLLFGANNAVNTVADGLYHMGFDIVGGRFLNEDGDRNARVETVAHWLDTLLRDQLEAGALRNPDVDPFTTPTTGTGLDSLIDVIIADPGLNQRISTSDIMAGAAAADGMNAIIVEAIRATGLANDGDINTADVRDLSEYIRANHYAEWVELHGDDEDGEETGFHLVQNDGATSRLYDRNAVNTVADGLYHLGFEIDGNNFLNEDGNRNARVETVAAWFSSLLRDDLANGTLANPDVDPYFTGTTGTGLDSLIDIITADPELNRRIPTSEITEGAAAADTMNTIIVSAIRATGIANDGTINTADVRDLNAYIRANHYADWVELHGDDEDGEETGFHLVQNDGANTRLFGNNAVNTVTDGLFHLGFEIDGSNLLNEDGNRNARVETVAVWLTQLLEDDLADGSLANPTVNPYAEGTTGTGLDSLIDIITADPGLNERISTTEITDGAEAANRMNQIIVDAILATGSGNDGEIDKYDLYDINAWIQANHYDEWVTLHGDDEDGKETGFHLVQNDGANTRLYGNNAVNTLADGIFHVGFDIVNGRFQNEDGNANASVEIVAWWLNDLLESDLASGALSNPDLAADPAEIAAAAVVTIDSVVMESADDYVEIEHSDVLEVHNGTIAVSFVADDVTARQTLFSKDASGNENGGHLSVFVRAGRIEARLQSADSEKWLGSTSLIREGEAHHVAVSFGDDGFRLYVDGQLEAVRTDFTTGIEANTNNLVVGANTWARNIYRPNWTANEFDGTLSDFAVYNRALTKVEIEALGGDVATTPSTAGTTGTGLDSLVDIIVNDLGLYRRIDQADIDGGSQAADALNHIIIDAIVGTGIANDGNISTADLRDVNAWIQTNRYDDWVELHGDDEDGEETGFHLVQNDGVISRLFANNAVNTVADGIYHIGFDIVGNRFLNEDGDANASVETVAWWLNELLAGDLAADTLSNADVDPYFTGTTGTGLDSLVTIITTDPSLEQRIPTSEITGGAQAADGMNQIIVEAIIATGLANDGEINTADVRDLNAWIQANRYDEWVELHGDDEDGEETGFHLVQNDGATTRLYGSNAVNTVADGLYHLGFDIAGNNLLNEDGNRNARVETVAWWLSDLLSDDLADGSLSNASVDPYATGTTGTGLDSLVTVITTDPSLEQRIPTSEITDGARAADAMNTIIIAGIRATGIANDGEINTADVRDLNAWIRANHYDAWLLHHGDDEDGEETGFHLVQNDGATSRLFDNNAVNTVADGIYHLGFEIDGNNVLNEDGNRNARVETLAYWLNELLADDLADGSLSNADVDPYASGSTGTGLDALVDLIANDPELNRRIATSEITAGAQAANRMNELLIEAIRATGAANDGRIDQYDMVNINVYLQAHHAEEWLELHGDDEDGEETGFHLEQNDGANTRLFGENAVNTVADGLYHAAFDIQANSFLNEDGNRNVRLETAAHWLNQLLREDLANGSLDNPDAIDAVFATSPI